MVFNKIKSSVSEKFERLNSGAFQKKIEKDLIAHFTRHSKQVIQDLTVINESPQLLNAIEIGKAYRALCDKIGKDSEIGNSAYVNFRNLVRQKDREVESIVDGMKYRFDYTDSDKFRVKANRSTHDIDQIYSSLKSVYLDLQKLEEERQLSREQKASEKRMAKQDREDGEKEKDQPKWMEIFDFKDADYYRSRGEEVPKVVLASEWAKSKLHPERVPQNLDLINQFRKTNKSEILDKYKHPLTHKQELSIVEEYFKVNQQKLLTYEQKGYYNHTMHYCKVYLEYIEDIGGKLRQDPEFLKTSPAILQKFREKFVALEDWQQRVERKYEIPTNHNPTESKVDLKTIGAIVQSYLAMRKNFIIAEEDKRILKYILNENKDQLKAEKIKDRQIKKQEKNEQKAEENARREKERQIKKEEKDRLKAEEAVRKEKQRKIREEARALAESQKTENNQSEPNESPKDVKKKQIKSLIDKERTRLKKKGTKKEDKSEDSEAEVEK